MCTVTYINNNGCRYFTSNRDENQNRPAPSIIESLEINGMSISYPKDPVAGGTWFAVKSNRAVAILLNGAFEKHMRTHPYKKSRGLVLLDLISADHFKIAFIKMTLEGIEPFTIVYAEREELSELTWDGAHKYIQSLDKTGNYIWSSVTLYDKPAICKRKKLFHQFINGNEVSGINKGSILDFHLNNHDDLENGFIIQRRCGMKTQSITQAILKDENVWINYHDLKTNTTIEKFIKPFEMVK